jgi:HSP20 family molecular chaperone IbpA/ribosome-associated toxin RatA of RatAB toxin-antitoxin module
MTRIEQSIEINVPVSTAYRQLTQFEQYPRFMEDVQEVRQLDETHLHWHTKAGNLDMEWDAEITQQVPDECIAWRNLNGPRYEGRIELRPKEKDRTEVKLTMECDPRQQILAQHGDAQKAIRERTEHDLARFKKFVEKLGKESHGWLGKIKDTEPLTTDAGAAQMAQEAARGGTGEGQGQQTQQSGRPASVASAMAEAWSGALRPRWLPEMLHAWGDPLSMMRRMSEDMDKVIERMIGSSAQSVQAQAAGPTWTPPVEVAQRDGEFVVCAELAGVKREDLTVEVSGDRLTIEGERRQEPSPGPQEYRRSERSYGHFYRVISLPPGADAGAASASLQDGMLEITVPVAGGGRQGRRIEIRQRR